MLFQINNEKKNQDNISKLNCQISPWQLLWGSQAMHLITLTNLHFMLHKLQNLFTKEKKNPWENLIKSTKKFLHLK